MKSPVAQCSFGKYCTFLLVNFVKTNALIQNIFHNYVIYFQYNIVLCLQQPKDLELSCFPLRCAIGIGCYDIVGLSAFDGTTCGDKKV